MNKNLFWKIFFSYLVVICLSFFVLDLLFRDEVKNVLTSQIETEMLSAAKLIELAPREKLLQQVAQMAQITRSRITLIDSRGRVFADTEKDIARLDNHFNRPEVQEARLKGVGKSVRFSDSLDIDMLYVAVAVRGGDAITGYVRLARPLHQVQTVIEKVYQSIFFAIVIVAAVSLLMALFISYRLAEPIKAMERFTERLRQGEPVGTMILYTADETKKLADNINFLVEELRDKIRIAGEEKSKLMTALTSITEGVLILGEQGVIEFASPVLAEMFSAQYDDICGKTLLETFRSVDLQKAYAEFKNTATTLSREIVLGDAEPVIMNISISAVHGHPEGEKTMIVFHDVTRLKKLEKIKTDFVANVTHEIKTPLTAIIGYLETLKSGAIENVEETKRFLDIILRQAERLNRLVDDLLMISNLEMKEMKLNFEKVSLPSAVEAVVSLVEAKAASKKIIIYNNLKKNLAPIRADRDKLTQILVNVLDNAVKFTPDGGSVFIDALTTEQEVVVSIRDTGIGVPADEIQRLGERFYRVDRSRSRELGGTGLGLSIVKHLMIAHGGKMEIESRLGHGTKVSLFFPRLNKGESS